MRTRLLRDMILLHVVNLLAVLRRLRNAVPGKYWGMLEALYKKTRDLRLALESGAGEGNAGRLELPYYNTTYRHLL